jgi:hypothetical protein
MSNYDSHAESGAAYVVKEDSQWGVYVTVVFPESVTEHRIASYYSEQMARTAARWMGWSANRQIPTPKVRISSSSVQD